MTVREFWDASPRHGKRVARGGNYIVRHFEGDAFRYLCNSRYNEVGWDNEEQIIECPDSTSVISFKDEIRALVALAAHCSWAQTSDGQMFEILDVRDDFQVEYNSAETNNHKMRIVFTITAHGANDIVGGG